MVQKFSYFKADITDPQNQIPARNCTVAEILSYLKSEQARTISEQFAYTIPEGKSYFKLHRFPAAAFAGTFAGRHDADLQNESGLLCLDLDHVTDYGFTPEELKGLVAQDPKLAVCLAFVSPSGDGLKVVVERPEGFTHLDYFKALQKYFPAAYGVELDASGKNISRLCFLPYDPEAYYNDAPAHMEEADLNEWRDLYGTLPEGTALEETSASASTKDPREKTGIVGAFCRCYSIVEAISTFLPNVYKRTSHANRYTYAQGSTYGGLVVLDGGTMAYSHHNTDPAGGRGLNAFDLVRIHKFGNDAGNPASTSYKKMTDFAMKDAKVMKQIAEADFSDLADTDHLTTTASTADLKALLEHLAKVDFREKAEEYGLLPNEKMTKKTLIVVVIRELVRQVEDTGAGLCHCNGISYLYANGYWQEQDPEALKIFLTNAAIKMGMNPNEAQHFEEQEALFNQFKSFACRLRPKRAENRVSINFENGTLDIVEGKLQTIRQPRKNDFLTYKLPYAYNPGAGCPLFLQYLNRVLPDESAQALLSEFAGYVLAPALKMQKALVLKGDGNNGKSVFCEIITETLGRENVSNYSMESLTQTDSRSRAQLEDKLLNYAGEGSMKIGIEAFKTLARNEPIEVRRLYGESYTMYNYAKLIFNCNELPRNVENSEGFRRSFLIIPFKERITETEKDPLLAQKITTAELPGVMNWILDGLQRLIKAKAFTRCETADREAEEFRRDSNSVLAFIEDNGLVPASSAVGGKQPLQALYDKYRSFCNEGGHRFIVSRKTFSKTLEKEGFQGKRESAGRMVYCRFNM